jgi:hypothetical protein
MRMLLALLTLSLSANHTNTSLLLQHDPQINCVKVV